MLPFFSKHTAYLVLFSFTASLVTLWSLLLPGYVLLLDWVPGAQTSFTYTDLTSYLHAPSDILLYLLHFIMPSWVLQKVTLFFVVFMMFFLPAYFYPWDRKHSIIFFTALVAVCNPFVYERLLAGQWRVLIGYALLFPLFFFLIRLLETRNRSALFGSLVSLLVLGMWSIHFFVIGVLLTALCGTIILVSLLRKKDFEVLFSFLKNAILPILFFVVCSLYWIVPFALSEKTTHEAFDTAHFEAFTTAEDGRIGVVGTVLTLRGFWAERHAWAGQFSMPTDNPWLFYSIFLVLFALTCLGFFSLLNNSEAKLVRVFILISFIAATVFATGVSAFLLWKINLWLLSNVSFWSGFRDAQKWVGVLAVWYTLLASYGLSFILSHTQKLKRELLVLLGACVVPLLFVPYILFGLDGQVKPTFYPASWETIAHTVEATPDCRILFLPWHQYYAVTWNDGQLIANPGAHAFACETITGENTELGAITALGIGTENYAHIEEVVTNNNPATTSIESAVTLLRENKITHIVYARDLKGRDIYNYPFLQSTQLELVLQNNESDGSGIDLYKIKTD